MSVLLVALWWALQLYFYLLIARFVIDLVLSVNPTWRPRGLILVATEIVMTLTDPPLRLVRAAHPRRAPQALTTNRPTLR